MLDLNRVAIQGEGGLLDRLAELPDPRKRRGVRHRVASILAVASCAVLSGARSFTAIGEFAAELGQDALARLGCRYHPARRCYIAPHEATIRRALHAVDADRLDRVVGGWLAEQLTAGWADAPLALAVDGKTVRGAKDRHGHQLHLLSAVVHHEGVVVAQRGVPKETNEISGFRPLLDDMDLTGVVVTADALHTQTDHAKFLVQDKQAGPWRHSRTGVGWRRLRHTLCGRAGQGRCTGPGRRGRTCRAGCASGRSCDPGSSAAPASH